MKTNMTLDEATALVLDTYGQYIRKEEDCAWYAGRAEDEKLIPEKLRLQVSDALKQKLKDHEIKVTALHKPVVMTKRREGGKHAECYEKGLHAPTKAGRASCRAVSK